MFSCIKFAVALCQLLPVGMCSAFCLPSPGCGGTVIW